jgi:hypothetical protein
VSVENGLDELWIEVKCQSNLGIAGSPRNSSRASLGRLVAGVETLNGLGALTRYRTQPNSEYRNFADRESDGGG